MTLPLKLASRMSGIDCSGRLHALFCSVGDVVECIGSSGYDADKFTLSLSLPISLSIRQHALWLHLGMHDSNKLPPTRYNYPKKPRSRCAVPYLLRCSLLSVTELCFSVISNSFAGKKIPGSKKKVMKKHVNILNLFHQSNT